MKIDLESVISLKIEGELGKYQTLPIEALIKISKSLQDLVFSIAKNDLPDDEAVDLNDFRLELTGFTKSSAVPKYELTRRRVYTISDSGRQREQVNKKFNEILTITTSGDYYKLKDLYPEVEKRNDIVNHVYDFANSFNNSPVKIFGQRETKGTYKVQKFKPKVKANLIGIVKEKKEEKIEESAVATITIVKSGKKKRNHIKDVFKPQNSSISYSPDVININEKQYILNFPLRCLLEKEEGYFVINNEVLGLIGTGQTIEDAEANFNEEFDFLYSRLNTLNEEQLSKRLLIIKQFINHYVKEVV